MFPRDVDGHLVAEDDHLLDGGVVGVAEFGCQDVGDLVEVAAVGGASRTGRQGDRIDQSSVSGGVARAGCAEQSMADADDLGGRVA